MLFSWLTCARAAALVTAQTNQSFRNKLEELDAMVRLQGTFAKGT